MVKRKLADKKVFPIGLGGMALDEYNPVPSDETAINLLKDSIKQGIEFLDTADVYGLGRNENLIAAAFTKTEKKRLLIATKGGCIRPDGKSWDTEGSPKHIKKAVLRSLDRLNLKYIHLYQLHAPDLRTPLKETLTAFKELQETGLIKHIGVSNFSLSQLLAAQKIIEVVSVQNHFNLKFKKDEQDLLPLLEKNDIAYIPYFPLGSGNLLNDHKLSIISKRSGYTNSQLCLGWILHKWPTAIPIPGTSNLSHLNENIKSAEIQLDENIISKLDSLY